jgi:hypothetical protein
MRILNITINVLSALVGIGCAIVALIFVCAVAAEHLWLLRSAGWLLFSVFAVHIFPLNYLAKKSLVACYLTLATAAAWGFGVLYYFAEVGDPTRDEGLLGANIPFQLAFCLSILPVARAVLRLISLKSIATAHSTCEAVL